jgi:hypothetical protein
MSVVVGTLLIDLKANTASFTQSMGKMGQLSANTANDVKRSLEKIGAAGIALASGLAATTAALVETSIETIGSMNRLAQASGTTIEKFSALAYAAKISRTEVDVMAMGMTRLAKAAFAAQNGNTALAAIFKRLGVDTQDSNHHLLDTSIIFTSLAVKFSQMKEGAGKTALAMEVMGKSGARMIPLLNELGKRQAELTEQAKRFGLVIGTDVAEKAQRFREVLTQLHAAEQGFGIQLTAAVLPALLKLSERLQQLGKDYDIPKLAEAFGEKLTSAINLTAEAFDFAVKHAHALKIALEALLALQVANIAIPFLTAAASAGTLTAGVIKLSTGLLGVTKLVPALTKVTAWIVLTAGDMIFFATNCGIAATAAYYLEGALAILTAPITIVIGVIAALAGGMYYFRDATFTAGGEVYKFRDAFVALWQTLTFTNKTGEKWLDILARLKKEREGVGAKPTTGPNPPPAPPFELPDTSGLGVQPKQKDLYGDEIIKLTQLVAAQHAYLAVLHGTPDEIQKVAAAEKADAIIVDLNIKYHDAWVASLHRTKAGLTDIEKSIIRQTVALEESERVLKEYGQSLVSEEHSAGLATQQARNLAAANLLGEDAVRRATIANVLLGLSYNKTAAELGQFAKELPALTALLNAKSNTDLVESTNREIHSLEQELAIRRISTAAAAQFVDAQRAAAMVVATYAIDQQIANNTDKEALPGLEQKRQLIVALTKAEWAEADAKAATALRSPLEVYQEEINTLIRETAALKLAQGGTMTYAQSVVLAGKAQDAFNKMTDETIATLLRFGGVRDGVDAFFLDMQKEAISTAKIIYDALHSAFDKLADELTKLVTGQKTDFEKMLKDLGRQMVNAEIKQQMQKGLAALGQKLGINLGSVKPDGSTAANALWVRMATAAGLPITGGIAGGGAPGGSGGGSGSGTGAGAGQAGGRGFFDSLLKYLGVRSPAGGASGSGGSSGGSGSGGYPTQAQEDAYQAKAAKDRAADKASTLPGGLVNRTGQTIDGVPSLGAAAAGPSPLANSPNHDAAGNLLDSTGKIVARPAGAIGAPPAVAPGPASTYADGRSPTHDAQGNLLDSSGKIVANPADSIKPPAPGGQLLSDTTHTPITFGRNPNDPTAIGNYAGGQIRLSGNAAAFNDPSSPQYAQMRAALSHEETHAAVEPLGPSGQGDVLNQAFGKQGTAAMQDTLVRKSPLYATENINSEVMARLTEGKQGYAGLGLSPQSGDAQYAKLQESLKSSNPDLAKTLDTLHQNAIDARTAHTDTMSGNKSLQKAVESNTNATVDGTKLTAAPPTTAYPRDAQGNYLMAPPKYHPGDELQPNSSFYDPAAALADFNTTQVNTAGKNPFKNLKDVLSGHMKDDKSKYKFDAQGMLTNPDKEDQRFLHPDQAWYDAGATGIVTSSRSKHQPTSTDSSIKYPAGAPPGATDEKITYGGVVPPPAGATDEKVTYGGVVAPPPESGFQVPASMYGPGYSGAPPFVANPAAAPASSVGGFDGGFGGNGSDGAGLNIGDLSGGGEGALGGLGDLSGFAEGGKVFGPGSGHSDSIPAMLSNGEHVMPADKARQWMPFLESMRTGKLAHFAAGGIVGMFGGSGGGSKRDGQTQATAFFSVTNGPAQDGKVKLPQGAAGILSKIGAIFSTAGSMGGGAGGGGGGMGSMMEMAVGGDVSPDQAYLVGEQGPEILRGVSGHVTNSSASRRMMSGSSSNHYYSIDARGTDPALTEQRTRMAIMAAHNSSVRTGFQVQQEHLMRTPQHKS